MNRIWDEDQISVLPVGQFPPLLANFVQDARFALPPDFTSNHLCHPEWFPVGEPWPNDLPATTYTDGMPDCCEGFPFRPRGGLVIGGSIPGTYNGPPYPRGGMVIGGSIHESYTPPSPPPPPLACPPPVTLCIDAEPGQLGVQCNVVMFTGFTTWRAYPTTIGQWYRWCQDLVPPPGFHPFTNWVEIRVGEVCYLSTVILHVDNPTVPLCFDFQASSDTTWVSWYATDPKGSAVLSSMEQIAGPTCETALPIDLDHSYDNRFFIGDPEQWYVIPDLPAGDYVLHIDTYEESDALMAVFEGSCEGLDELLNTTLFDGDYPFTHTVDGDVFLRFSPGSFFIAYVFYVTPA